MLSPPKRAEGVRMELPRRRFLQLAAGAAVVPTLPRTGWTQAYPARPIRLIVPFAPGGQLDAVARIFAHQMLERLGRQCVVGKGTGSGVCVRVSRSRMQATTRQWI